MPLKSTLFIISACVCAFLLFAFSAVAQLIEPTRTLASDTAAMSTLTVLSEPPGLQVTLDNNALGKTPVYSANVDGGTHVLQVDDKQTSLQIAVGKSIRIALFKGSFIELPEQKEATLPKKPQAEGTIPPAKSQAQSPQKTVQTNDPFYWPLNPRGPID